MIQLLIKKLKTWLIEKGFFKQEASSPKGKLSFFHWMVIIVCLGLAAMIFQNYLGLQERMREGPSFPPVQAEESIPTARVSNKDSPLTIEEFEELYIQQLEGMLNKVVGVGDVSVMVNLESTAELVVEKDIKTQFSKTSERDREGGNREIEDRLNDEQVVLTRQGNDEQALVLMTRKPQVRGVLVVAKGAENMQVKTWITEAVQRVLDVPAHKISVLPKKP